MVSSVLFFLFLFLFVASHCIAAAFFLGHEHLTASETGISQAPLGLIIGRIREQTLNRHLR